MNTVKVLISMILLAIPLGCDTEPKDADFFEGGDLAPPSASTLQMTGRVLAAKGMFDQAEYVLTRLLREYPDDLAAYTELAELLVGQGRILDGVRILQEGLQRFPGNAIILNDLGMCRLLQRNLPEATEAFKEAMASDPGDAVYIGNCALVTALAGDEKGARLLWSRVASPDEVRANLALAKEAKVHFLVTNSD